MKVLFLVTAGFHVVAACLSFSNNPTLCALSAVAAVASLVGWFRTRRREMSARAETASLL
ncbi:MULTISPECIES: hypothetical protein [unclassified Paenarthrobacter]|uniref:hypothetical protein n=1 Tax=unclassified Paenarthrobacter TaxID=2634190 RepID=UPI003CF2FFA0